MTTEAAPDRTKILDVLRAEEIALRADGVTSLSVFGSVARDAAGPLSDIDLLLDIDDFAGFTLFRLVALQQRAARLLGRHVDVTTRGALHPRRRARIEAEAIRVF